MQTHNRSNQWRQCGANQPYKEKLSKQKEKVAQEWKASVNKVYDSTNLLIINVYGGLYLVIYSPCVYFFFFSKVTLAVEPATRVGEIPPLDIEGPSATQAEMAADPGSDSLSVPLLTTETDTELTDTSGLTPPVSFGLTPPVSSGQSPPVTSGLTPALSSGLTPPVSFGLCPHGI
ncbi:hypothetical protein F7725_028031 [Dissostichus mawsoni]|uniref:Uncharacterized protein n=1 Tax=Dissostichus mawsoni TaxID=36200 RepID=A0A7J5XF44_DISMA|nr:hypothetical protein F7725_028031 [Dissostichus mawsoni]